MHLQDAIRNERIIRARAAREAAARAAAADGIIWDGDQLVRMPPRSAAVVNTAPFEGRVEWDTQAERRCQQPAQYNAAPPGFGTGPASNAALGPAFEDGVGMEGMEQRRRRRRGGRRGRSGSAGAAGDLMNGDSVYGTPWDWQSLNSEGHTESDEMVADNRFDRTAVSAVEDAGAAVNGYAVSSAADGDDGADVLSELLGGLGVLEDGRPRPAPRQAGETPVQQPANGQRLQRHHSAQVPLLAQQAVASGHNVLPSRQQHGTGPLPNGVGASEMGAQRYMPQQPQPPPQQLHVSGVTAAAPRAAAAPAAAVAKPRQEGYVFSVGFTPTAPAPAPVPAAYRLKSAARDTAAAVSAAPVQRPRQQALHAEPAVPRKLQAAELQTGQAPADGAISAPTLRKPSGSNGSRMRRAAVSQTDALLICPITQVCSLGVYPAILSTSSPFVVRWSHLPVHICPSFSNHL